MSVATTLSSRVSPGWGWLLLAILPIEAVLVFGLTAQAFALTAFGWGMLALVRFELSGDMDARHQASWLGLASMLLLVVSSIAADDGGADLRRALFGVVIAILAMGGSHLLYPEGLERFDVFGSAAVAFVLGWAGWVPLFASFAAAMVLSGIVAAYFAYRSRDELPSGTLESVRVSFVGVLGAVAMVAIVLSA